MKCQFWWIIRPPSPLVPCFKGWDELNNNKVLIFAISLSDKSIVRVCGCEEFTASWLFQTKTLWHTDREKGDFVHGSSGTVGKLHCGKQQVAMTAVGRLCDIKSWLWWSGGGHPGWGGWILPILYISAYKGIHAFQDYYILCCCKRMCSISTRTFVFLYWEHHWGIRRVGSTSKQQVEVIVYYTDTAELTCKEKGERREKLLLPPFGNKGQ